MNIELYIVKNIATSAILKRTIEVNEEK